MKTWILTDSACDLDPEEIIEKDISMVPLTIHFDEEKYLDGVTLSKDMFYDLMLKQHKYPKTSQPSPHEFIQIFEKVKASGDAIVCILLSSGLSGTVSSAILAKNIVEYANIYIVDSLNAVTGERLLLDIALSLREKNYSAEAIYQQLEELKKRMILCASPDTLEFLHKGGRLTYAQVKLGNIANLKPVIVINDVGKLEPIAKVIGKKKAIRTICRIFDKYEIDTDYPIYFPYSYDYANSEALMNYLSKAYPNIKYDKKNSYNLGPTIGAHIGPGAYGVTYISKKNK